MVTRRRSGASKQQNQSGKQRNNTRKGIRCGDQVMIIAGGSGEKRANKGKVGKVLRFVGDDRVVVEGLNFIVRHTRPSQTGKPSGKVVKEGSVHLSNVMLYVETLGRPVRVKFSVRADGTKVRGYNHPETKQFVQLA